MKNRLKLVNRVFIFYYIALISLMIFFIGITTIEAYIAIIINTYFLINIVRLAKENSVTSSPAGV